MAKKDSSEETTKGLVADKLKEIDGYPMAQNTTVDGILFLCLVREIVVLN